MRMRLSALEEVERLEHLASSLLALARTRAAGPPPDRTVSLRTIALRAAHDATTVRIDGDREVRVDVNGEASTRGDAEALERALRNLVENAYRHARSRIAVTISSDLDTAQIAIVDDGPGFPPDVLTHDYTRFAPGDSPQAHGGAGLGLAIVDAIVNTHGGHVTIGNGSDGDGAVVHVILPAPSPPRGLTRLGAGEVTSRALIVNSSTLWTIEP